MTLLAAVVQGAVGFGFTLLAVAFFLTIIGSSEAVSLLIIVNLTISLVLVARLRPDLDGALLSRLMIGAIPGLPVGLVVFSRADVDQLKLIAAVGILGFVIARLISKPPERTEPGAMLRFRTPTAVGLGALAGGMATSLGLPGPPVVLYLTALGAGRDATRSITLTFFAVAYGASLVLQSVTVGVSRGVWMAAAALVPVAAAGAFLGHRLSARVSESTFPKVVLTLIASTGAYVLLDTLLR